MRGRRGLIGGRASWSGAVGVDSIVGAWSNNEDYEMHEDGLTPTLG
jgi:hypothetical protein